MQNPVFISYSSKDATLANKIVGYLEAQGYPCWIAPRNITSGHDYTDMINDAILSCRAVVLIVSGHSLQSQWVKKELSTAVSYNKTILPYRISNVEIKGGLQFLLNNVQWIDATSNPSGHFPDLVDGLEQRLSLSAPPTPKHFPWIFIVSAVVLVGVGIFLWQKAFSGSELSTRSLELADASDSSALSGVPSALPTTSTSESALAVHPVEVQPVQKTTSVTQDKKKSDRTSVTPVQKQNATKEVATPKIETNAEEKQVETVPDTAGQAAARQAEAERKAAALAKKKEQSYQNKKKEALKCYNTQRYREALNLFRELQRDNPQDKDINAYISACQKMIL